MTGWPPRVPSKTIMTDATCLKAHRTASSLRAKGGARAADRAQGEDQETFPWIVSPSTGGMNTKLHAVTDAKGRPIRFFMPAGQKRRPCRCGSTAGQPAQGRLAGCGSGRDADWLREAIENKGTNVRIPGRASRKRTVNCDKRRCKRRDRIEIMFGRRKDGRRVATRYGRCPETFLSAIALAPTTLLPP